MINVMIADDSFIMRKLIKANLDKLSFPLKIFDVKDGKEALEIIVKQQQPIDVLFLDIDMPKITGLDISNYFEKKGIEMEVVIISSQLDPKNKALLRNFGVRHYVPKPFNLETFNEVVIPIFENIDGVAID
jgi:YesN/AraC family two-component response regulator